MIRIERVLKSIRRPARSTKSLIIRLCRRFMSFFVLIAHNLKGFGQATKQASKSLWRGQVEEKPKIVLRKEVWQTLFRCWPHFITLSVTAVLAWLNIHGLYVGDQFQGCTSDNCQVLDRLGLQVAAKLVELLIVVSLGMILVDVVHRKLLHSSDGLPLGLLSLKQRFLEVQYLASAEFRFGIAGISPWFKALAYGFLVVISTLISLFAGPSAALLLVPDRRSDWPAGGATIYLTGSEDQIWPSRLPRTAVGGPHCVSPTSKQLTSDDRMYYECIWAGFSSISERFKEAQYTSMTDMSIHDSVLYRTLGEGFNGLNTQSAGVSPETWVHGVHLATGLMARAAGQIWFQALLAIPSSSKYHPLRWRSQGGTSGTLQAWAPIVRTTCDKSKNFELLHGNSPIVQKYPYLPEYDARPDLKIQLHASSNSMSQLGTRWIPVPPAANLTNNSTTSDMPSAFLNIFVPQKISNATFNATFSATANATSNNTATYFACSIDSRWAKASYVGTPIDAFDEHYIQTTTGFHQRNYPPTFPGWQYSSLPVNDGSWRKVQLDMDWLEALFPIINTATNGTKNSANNTSSTTSLASLLSDMNIANYTDFDVTPTLEGLIATLVADGMSRTAFRSIGLPPENLTDPLNILPDESSTKWASFMDGSYKFPRPDGNATEMKMSVTVTGYAYRADNKAYQLALAVLFLHAALAIGHIIYTFKMRVACTAWDSMVGYLILAAASGLGKRSDRSHDNGQDINNEREGEDDDVFKNASSGIEKYRTMGTEVRIRAKRKESQHNVSGVPNGSIRGDETAEKKGNDPVKMLFGRTDECQLEKEGYEQLAIGRAYS